VNIRGEDEVRHYILATFRVGILSLSSKRHFLCSLHYQSEILLTLFVFEDFRYSLFDCLKELFSSLTTSRLVDN